MMRGAAGALVATLAALLCWSANAQQGIYGRTLLTYNSDLLKNRYDWRRSAGPIEVRPDDNELTERSNDPPTPVIDDVDQSGMPVGGCADSGRRCLDTAFRVAKLLFGLRRRQGHDSDDQGEFYPFPGRRSNLLLAATRRNDDDPPPPGNFDEIDSSPLDMGG